MKRASSYRIVQIIPSFSRRNKRPPCLQNWGVFRYDVTALQGIPIHATVATPTYKSPAAFLEQLEFAVNISTHTHENTFISDAHGHREPRQVKKPGVFKRSLASSARCPGSDYDVITHSDRVLRKTAGGIGTRMVPFEFPCRFTSE